MTKEEFTEIIKPLSLLDNPSHREFIRQILTANFNKWLEDKAKNISPNTELSDSDCVNYEYEMFFNSEPNESVQIHRWYPIATDRIKNPEKIEHYIKSGLLRRITNAGRKQDN